MTSTTAEHIICAIRSRPGGEETVDRAIARASDSQARLTFFQVVDAKFLRRTSITSVSLTSAYRELRDVAAFTLALLCDQARQRGVSQVDYVVRQGDFRQELHQAIVEVGADVVVIGRPKTGPGRSVFKIKELDAFVAELEQLGAQVDRGDAE